MRISDWSSDVCSSDLNGEWDALPAPTYSIGFARSYANVVGLNGSEIGVELREELGANQYRPAAPTAYYEPADPARVPPRPLALIAGAIARLLVVGYAFWRVCPRQESDLQPTRGRPERPR